MTGSHQPARVRRNVRGLTAFRAFVSWQRISQHAASAGKTSVNMLCSCRFLYAATAGLQSILTAHTMLSSEMHGQDAEHTLLPTCHKTPWWILPEKLLVCQDPSASAW